MLEFSSASAPVRHWRTNVVVIGSGVAGLSCALALAPLPVMVLTKTPQSESGSSVWAKGGIAAALAANDSPESHSTDTINAGAGLCDPEMTLMLAREGATAVRSLVDAGVPFDRTDTGELALGREAAHSFGRIVHAGGDATGRTLIASLLEDAERAPSVHLLSGCFAVDLVVQRGRVAGLIAFSPDDGWIHIHANRVVLAAGGTGHLWRETTNPPENTGDGMAIAARAGAALADLEFVQFHPTALIPRQMEVGAPLPLLTEALRGAGAVLLDGEGRAFMRDEHPLADLAPRDVVARAIARRTARGDAVFLDLRPAIANRGEAAFPQALLQCRLGGYRPLEEPVPIAPAAHYHMGGVVTDANGRTSLDGLWACGEVACTGVHGANRLASNSLLEGLVFGQRVAVDIRGHDHGEVRMVEPPAVYAPGANANEALAKIGKALRQTMSEHVGIVRTGGGLSHARLALEALEADFLDLCPRSTAYPEGDFADLAKANEVRNMLLVAQLVVGAAIRRTESRGAHFRLDYPESDTDWAHRLVLGMADLMADEATSDPRPAASAP
ncbi:MAG: L-aspartate oxidase [Rhodospirillales bacterium]